MKLVILAPPAAAMDISLFGRFYQRCDSQEFAPSSRPCVTTVSIISTTVCVVFGEKFVAALEVEAANRAGPIKHPSPRGRHQFASI